MATNPPSSSDHSDPEDSSKAGDLPEDEQATLFAGGDDQPTIMANDTRPTEDLGTAATAMTIPAGGPVAGGGSQHIDPVTMPTQAGVEDETMATMPGGSASDATMATMPSGAQGSRGDHQRSNSSAGLVPGAVWGGDYQLDKMLGQGGMGAVYLARQLSLDRLVAVKVLPSHLSSNDQFRQRFLLEAKAVAKISSPNVINVIAAGTHEGHHYFVMEFVEGKDLSGRLKDGYSPDHREALDLVMQAAAGLASAGELGIVHRDIKPGNMMIASDGTLKIMDFGLVKLAKDNMSLTMTGTVMGTVSYFSPEQGRGEECDQRTDIYALGIVFYELLTGRLPYVGGDATSVIYQHIHSDPPLPTEIDPKIPEAYQAIVLKCIQKRAADRYQNAQELVADLKLVRDGDSPRTAMFDPEALRAGATMSKTSSFDAERKQGGGALKAVLALVVLGGLGAGGWFGYQAWLDQQGTAGDSGNQSNATGSSQPTTVSDPNLASGGEGGPEVTPQTVADPVGTPTGASSPRLVEARSALVAGNLDEAERMLARVDNRDSGWEEFAVELLQARHQSYLRSAESALSAGDTERANDFAGRALEAWPESPDAAALIKRVVAASEVQAGLEAVEGHLSIGDTDQATALLGTLDPVLASAQVELLATRSERLRRTTTTLGELLATAENALIGGDLATARSAYNSAIQAWPNQAATRGLRAVTVSTQFQQALHSAHLTQAEALLTELGSLVGVDSPLVTARSAQLDLRRAELVVDAALAEGDLAAARVALAAIPPSAPQHQRLSRAVTVATAVAAFDAALAAEDLPVATTTLAEVERVAGASAPETIAARERLIQSELEEQARERAAAAAAAAFATEQTRIDGLIAAAEPDLPAAREAISALAATPEGARRAAEIDALRAATDAREREITLTVTLAFLDRAIVDSNLTVIDALVQDQAHNAALKGLVGQPGLAVQHSLESVAQSSAEALLVDCVITASYATAPEVALPYRYTLSQIGNRWVITAAAQR